MTLPLSPEAQQRRIIKKRQEIVKQYPGMWAQIIQEWNSSIADDRAWLTYSSNYLVRMGKTRWALDPLTLHWRVPEAQPVDTAHDLEGLSFILLTHKHADHLDLDLMRNLSKFPILWIIPEHLLGVAGENKVSRKKVIVPKPLETLEIEGIRITPFNGLHWHMASNGLGERRGVPATGYRVEFCGKRWLFPGDVRTYDRCKLCSLGPVDGLFAHLWLGHGCALNEKPPLLEAFCSFCLDLQPKRIVLTHLHEVGRKSDDYWHEGHVQQVRDWFRSEAPDRIVEYACLGNSIEL
jgi:hypothetical protein